MILWGTVVLCVYCRMFSSIPTLYPLDATGTLPPVSARCPLELGGNCPPFTTLKYLYSLWILALQFYHLFMVPKTSPRAFKLNITLEFPTLTYEWLPVLAPFKTCLGPHSSVESSQISPSCALSSWYYILNHFVSFWTSVLDHLYFFLLTVYILIIICTEVCVPLLSHCSLSSMLIFVSSVWLYVQGIHLVIHRTSWWALIIDRALDLGFIASKANLP